MYNKNGCSGEFTHLIRVPDHESPRSRASQQGDELVLGCVGVLELVDKDMPPSADVTGEQGGSEERQPILFPLMGPQHSLLRRTDLACRVSLTLGTVLSMATVIPSKSSKSTPLDSRQSLCIAEGVSGC